MVYPWGPFKSFISKLFRRNIKKSKWFIHGVPLSPLLANCFVEDVETIALDSYFLKHKFWEIYMDDIISVWNYGEKELKGFLEHLNFWRGDLKLKIELEEDKKLPF